MTNTEHLNRLYEAMKELQDILKKDKAEELSQMEIDLSLDKLKHMYDVLLKVKAAPVFEADPKIAEVKEEVKEPIPVVDFVMDIDESIQEMESPLHEIETDEIITTKPKPEIESEIVQEPEVHSEEEIAIEPEVEEEIMLEEEIETEEEIKIGDVLDLFNENKDPEENNSLIEKEDIPTEQETVADRLQKNKLESIKSAIGINEKFFFLNELFGGDLQTYNDHIEKLDSQITLVEASAFLVELSEQFNWDKESEAVEQINQMLNNKFS